jgi:hypothetical protein
MVSSAGAFQQVNEDDLMDAYNFKIERALLSRTTKQAKKHAQKAPKEHP